MAEQINIQAAKTQLSRLVAQVELGEEIVLARAGKPVARIVPLAASRPRRPGAWAGRIWISENFDDPLDDETQAAFEGRRD